MHDLSKGMHWIGYPASLGWIMDRGDEQPTYDVQAQVSTSIGGGVRARVSRARPNRVWTFNMPDAHADEVAHVESLLLGSTGPYQLVTADAQVSNVLTPDRSMLRSPRSGNVSMAGSWPKADGTWTTFTGLNPAAMFGAIASVGIGPAPVPPVRTGRPVTVSAWVATAREAGARVRLYWLNAAGSTIGSPADGNFVTGMDVLRRSTATGAPPAGAVACYFNVQYAEIIAEPQITWTTAPVEEWAPGRGADRVTITGFGKSTNLAVPDSRNLRRGDYTLSLLETGRQS